MEIELLSPAKTLEHGREAINHGADAVYIGAPAFGARQAATNPIEDIEALVRYAHLYRAKVYVTLNTLLFDSEIDEAVQMAHRLYDAGADALIIQDMGLLECNLPPIALHASTQCHNVSADHIRFLERVGMKRVILARETSIDQISAIREATSVELEAFVHGALCVSYSGQCYMSQYLTRRSGNRGECSQPCRSAYDLLTTSGRPLLHDRHVLSLRDFMAAQSIRSIINAGICSFKIEGRLKDLGYVKNVTAYYRQLLDDALAGHSRASSGNSTFSFSPDPERSFNRGFTDYFLHQRQPMAMMATPKSTGKYLGKVAQLSRNSLVINTPETITPGDGLCCLPDNGKLQGFLVNRAEGKTVYPNQMPDIKVGEPVWRNHDHAFEKQLQTNSAVRKIAVDITFYETDNGFGIRMLDEDGLSVETLQETPHQEARNRGQSHTTVVSQLQKLGSSPFVTHTINDTTQGKYFVAASTLNLMRRNAVEKLITHRINHFTPSPSPIKASSVPYPATTLDYRANIVNEKAKEFYKHHGIREMEYGLEKTGCYEGKALMTTKYCLRYELGNCLKHKVGGERVVDIKPEDSLVIRNNGREFRLEFDCHECVMRIYPSRTHLGAKSDSRQKDASGE